MAFFLKKEFHGIERTINIENTKYIQIDSVKKRFKRDSDYFNIAILIYRYCTYSRTGTLCTGTAATPANPGNLGKLGEHRNTRTPVPIVPMRFWTLPGLLVPVHVYSRTSSFATGTSTLYVYPCTTRVRVPVKVPTRVGTRVPSQTDIPRPRISWHCDSSSCPYTCTYQYSRTSQLSAASSTSPW